MPVRLFFLADALLDSNWYHNALGGGLIFDRCRIIDYLPTDTDGSFAGVSVKVRTWLQCAAGNHTCEFLCDVIGRARTDTTN
jgi:hypothetical protein